MDAQESLQGILPGGPGLANNVSGAQPRAFVNARNPTNNPTPDPAYNRAVPVDPEWSTSRPRNTSATSSIPMNTTTSVPVVT